MANDAWKAEAREAVPDEVLAAVYNMGPMWTAQAVKEKHQREASERVIDLREAVVRPDDGLEPPKTDGSHKLADPVSEYQQVVRQRNEAVQELQAVNKRWADGDEAIQRCTLRHQEAAAGEAEVRRALVHAQLRGQEFKNQILHERLVREQIDTLRVRRGAERELSQADLAAIGLSPSR